MTTFQMGLTIAVCTAATMLTRFLPFLIFSSKDQQPPEVVQYLGRVLPASCPSCCSRRTSPSPRWWSIWAMCCPPPSSEC